MLKGLDDDYDLLSEVIDIFVQEAPVSVAELGAALFRTDVLALADAAHVIKGISEYFCVEKIISRAVNLEHSARTASAPRQLLLHGSTSCIHDSRAHAGCLYPVGNAAKTDLQLITNDLIRAMADLIDNLLQKNNKNNEC